MIRLLDRPQRLPAHLLGDFRISSERRGRVGRFFEPGNVRDTNDAARERDFVTQRIPRGPRDCGCHRPRAAGQARSAACSCRRSAGRPARTAARAPGARSGRSRPAAGAASPAAPSMRAQASSAERKETSSSEKSIPTSTSASVWATASIGPRSRRASSPASSARAAASSCSLGGGDRGGDALGPRQVQPAVEVRAGREFARPRRPCPPRGPVRPAASGRGRGLPGTCNSTESSPV